MGEGERLEMLPVCLPFGVSTGGRWCRVQGLSVVFRGVFRPFVRFSALLVVCWLEIWLYFAF